MPGHAARSMARKSTLEMDPEVLPASMERAGPCPVMDDNRRRPDASARRLMLAPNTLETKVDNRFDKMQPCLAELLPNMARFGECWSKSGGAWPGSAETRRIWSEAARSNGSEQWSEAARSNGQNSASDENRCNHEAANSEDPEAPRRLWGSDLLSAPKLDGGAGAKMGVGQAQPPLETHRVESVSN